MLAVQISTSGLDHGSYGIDRSGGQARGLDRAPSCVGRELRDAAGSEVSVDLNLYTAEITASGAVAHNPLT